MAKVAPITQLKAARRMLADAAEILMDLEQVHFSTLSFVGCEKAVNDALDHHGDVSWNDMMKEIAILKKGSQV